MKTLEERLRRSADDIQAATARTSVPSLPPDSPVRGQFWIRITVAAGVAVFAIGALFVLVNRTPSSDTATPAPTQRAPSDQPIDRFILDGMHVEEAAQWDDSRSSELWLNTPSDDPNSALPALSITTGEAAFANVADWDMVDGRTVEVFGQRVPLHTINGDPMGIVWTTPSGLAVEIVGEGYSLGQFDAAIGQLRRMTEAEWSAIADPRGAPTTATIATLPVLNDPGPSGD